MNNNILGSHTEKTDNSAIKYLQLKDVCFSVASGASHTSVVSDFYNYFSSKREKKKKILFSHYVGILSSLLSSKVFFLIHQIYTFYNLSNYIYFFDTMLKNIIKVVYIRARNIEDYMKCDNF